MFCWGSRSRKGKVSQTDKNTLSKSKSNGTSSTTNGNSLETEKASYIISNNNTSNKKLAKISSINSNNNNKKASRKIYTTFKCDLSEALLPSEESLLSIQMSNRQSFASRRSDSLMSRKSATNTIDNNKSAEILLFYSKEEQKNCRSSLTDFMTNPLDVDDNDDDFLHYKSLWGKDIREWGCGSGSESQSQGPIGSDNTNFAVSSPSLNHCTSDFNRDLKNVQDNSQNQTNPFVCDFFKDMDNDDFLPLPSPPPTPPETEKVEEVLVKTNSVTIKPKAKSRIPTRISSLGSSSEESGTIPPPLIYINTSTSTSSLFSFDSISPPISSVSNSNVNPFGLKKSYESTGCQTEGERDFHVNTEKSNPFHNSLGVEVGTMTMKSESQSVPHFPLETGTDLPRDLQMKLMRCFASTSEEDEDEDHLNSSLELDSEDLISQIVINNLKNSILNIHRRNKIASASNSEDGDDNDNESSGGSGSSKGQKFSLASKPEDRDSAVLLEESHYNYNYDSLNSSNSNSNSNYYSPSSSNNNNNYNGNNNEIETDLEQEIQHIGSLLLPAKQFTQVHDQDRNRLSKNGSSSLEATECTSAGSTNSQSDTNVQGKGQGQGRLHHHRVPSLGNEKGSSSSPGEIIQNNVNNNNHQNSNGSGGNSSSLNEEISRMALVIAGLESRIKSVTQDGDQQREQLLLRISDLEKATGALAIVAQNCDIHREALHARLLEETASANASEGHLHEKLLEIDSLRTELDRERECHKEEVAQVVKDHEAQLSRLVNDHYAQTAELRKSHEDGISDVKKGYVEEIEKLKELHRLELEQTNKRHRELLEEHRKQSPHDLLVKEVESLEAVLEMRNGEIRDLRKELIDYRNTIDCLQLTKEQVRTLQAKVEDLEAQLEKARSDKRLLQEKYREIENNLNNLESKNVHLSQCNEELSWKIQTFTPESGKSPKSVFNLQQQLQGNLSNNSSTLSSNNGGSSSADEDYTPVRLSNLMKEFE